MHPGYISKMVYESTAAAAGLLYVEGKLTSESIKFGEAPMYCLVLDHGGGTFDATVLEVKNEVPFGNLLR